MGMVVPHAVLRAQPLPNAICLVSAAELSAAGGKVEMPAGAARLAISVDGTESDAVRFLRPQRPPAAAGRLPRAATHHAFGAPDSAGGCAAPSSRAARASRLIGVSMCLSRGGVCPPPGCRIRGAAGCERASAAGLAPRDWGGPSFRAMVAGWEATDRVDPEGEGRGGHK